MCGPKLTHKKRPGPGWLTRLYANTMGDDQAPLLVVSPETGSEVAVRLSLKPSGNAGSQTSSKIIKEVVVKASDEAVTDSRQLSLHQLHTKLLGRRTRQQSWPMGARKKFQEMVERKATYGEIIAAIVPALFPEKQSSFHIRLESLVVRSDTVVATFGEDPYIQEGAGGRDEGTRRGGGLGGLHRRGAR